MVRSTVWQVSLTFRLCTQRTDLFQGMSDRRCFYDPPVQSMVRPTLRRVSFTFRSSSTRRSNLFQGEIYYFLVSTGVMWAPLLFVMSKSVYYLHGHSAIKPPKNFATMLSRGPAAEGEAPYIYIYIYVYMYTCVYVAMLICKDAYEYTCIYPYTCV